MLRRNQNEQTGRAVTPNLDVTVVVFLRPNFGLSLKNFKVPLSRSSDYRL